VIERLGLVESADVQVHVADRRACRGTVPRRTPAGGDHLLDVQRVGRHGELAIAVPPCLSRTVGVYLDPQIVGIPQVERFADQVIGHAHANAKRRGVGGKSSEHRAVRQQDGEVVEPQGAAARPFHAASGVQRNQHAIVTVRAEARGLALAVQHAKPEHSLVIVEGTLQIADLQPHRAEARRVGQTELPWRDPVRQHGAALSLRHG
jgi:hypothetical protein